MPTREIITQFNQFDSNAMGVGPINEHANHIPQSLLNRHTNLAAKPNKSPCYSTDRKTTENYTPEEYVGPIIYHASIDGKRADTVLVKKKSRVRSTGARTPGSLATEIRAQINYRTNHKKEEEKAASN
ncbi:hypothetical protein BGZ63DRAFT_42650 [Mariannaea sp. PMI_226]|nr:hypothetical protein BGZ63DRAFT_42650 [Mariannaea sp. PMI_226]